MKKKNALFYTLLILFAAILPNRPYKELNQIKIITKIEKKCEANNTIWILTETIPKKGDNGIEYEYKTYSVKNLKKEIKKQNFYIKKAKIKEINCKTK